MRLGAWLTIGHDDYLGHAHPDVAVTNVFEDPMVDTVCPANPEVVRYAIALAGDVARHEVDEVVVESLHFHPLEHGHHHERYLIDLGPLDRFLLGLCFCGACRASARTAGVDSGSLTKAVGQHLDRSFASARHVDHDPITTESVAGLWDGELAAYLASQRADVTRAHASVADALAGTGTDLVVLDQTGALRGFSDGRPPSGAVTDDAWLLGLDPAAISRICSAYQVLAYARDADAVAQDVRGYRSVLDGACLLRAVLRPGHPDCHETANLTLKVEAALAAGASGVDFYNYGMARLEEVDRVRVALSGADRPLSKGD